MNAIAAASSAEQNTAWAYVAVFALMALSFAGIPALGAVVVGWAAVLASQGELNIVVVLIVAALGAEAGGLAGYHIGELWGRKLLAHEDRWQERRQKTVAVGEKIYAKWGRLAVFFTSTIVSGILRMKYSQFAVWNFVVGAVYVLSIGPAAYGAGKVSAGGQDGASLGALVAGLAVATTCAVVAARYYRRRKPADRRPDHPRNAALAESGDQDRLDRVQAVLGLAEDDAGARLEDLAGHLVR